jgi:ribonuclease HII
VNHEETRGKQKQERRKKGGNVDTFLPLFPSLSFEGAGEITSPFSSSSSPLLIAGVDEVGRGSLFGPVVAAACIISEPDLALLGELGVTDSKLLSPKTRSLLALKIRECAIACQVGMASVQEIDRLNILQGTLLSMKRAVLRLKVPPDFCWIDGNQKIPNLGIPQETMIKGDRNSLLIASASIIAKVWRDELMIRLADKYPEYDLENNKGYGTAKHREALQRYGVTPQHRLSFCANFLGRSCL